MRCTQLIGLPQEAVNFLEENCKRVPSMFCPHCGEVVSTKQDLKVYEDASSVGMHDDGPLLKLYNLKDGKIAREEVQADPWSSGPVIFLRLVIEEMIGTDTIFVKKIEWTEDEIIKNT